MKVELLNTVDNIAAKGEIAHYEPFSPYAKMFLNVVCWRGIGIFGKGYVCIVYLNN